ncbi:MAG: SpoIIE family protein phosphatase, partial [Acetatifactor sp.]|nr:SpoIIE family protein phosphatase [Acetatifactor sp.]
MKTVESELRTAQVSELCRRRLLNYADSFYELARSYDGSFCPDTEDRQEILSERRIWENRQILKSHLQEMAKIMTDVAGEVLCYRPMEDKKRRLIIHAMRDEGIRAENPCYIMGDDGREAIVITMSTGKGGSISAEEAADMLSVLLNKRLQLSAGSPFMVEKEPRSYVLEGEARFVALTGFARVTEEDEAISGDNYAVLEAERGKLTVMLSDGTGSGEQAAKNSGQVLDLMEKLLEAGYDSEAAVEMVNTALFVTGEDRNHPTLDVCSINLYMTLIHI